MLNLLHVGFHMSLNNLIQCLYFLNDFGGSKSIVKQSRNKVKKSTLSCFQSFEYQVFVNKKYRNRNYYGISVVMSSRMLEPYRFFTLIFDFTYYAAIGLFKSWL